MALTRGGRVKEQAEPERRCIATGVSLPKDTLVRFVVGPDGNIVPDIRAKLPGRGIYVAPTRAALDKAAKKNLFSRAAKQTVSFSETLSDEVERQLCARVTEGIALARKAGQAVCGYEKVKTWLQTGQAAVLIQANDGSERGKTKLSSPPGKGTWIGCLDAGELGLAFGRDRVIHGALGAGRLGQRVIKDAARLKRMREASGGEATGKGTKTT